MDGLINRSEVDVCLLDISTMLAKDLQTQNAKRRQM